MRAEGAVLDFGALHDVASAWLAADQRPRLVLRSNSRVLWINAGAERLLDECRGIDAVDGAIRLSDPEDDARLHAFLRDTSSAPQTMAVKFEGEDSFCVFRGRRIAGMDGVCVDVRYSSTHYRPTLADFAPIFGLTASEARTASALYSGQNAREVADERRISVDTVRSHIRQLYSKIGVSGREQLFRQLDAFRTD